MTGRDNRIDSIKGLLILLVVLGHIIGSCGSGEVCWDVWKIIYVFHMPLFILISGYFTSIRKDISSLWKGLLQIVIPLLIFHVLYVAISIFVFGNSFSLTYLFTPYWILWYLLSLVFWRVFIQFTPNKILVSPYLYILIASVVALFCGLMPHGRILSIQRTLNFYPFFLYGFYLKHGVFKMKLWPKYTSYGFVLLTIVLIVYKMPPPIDYNYASLLLRGADHYSLSTIPLKVYFYMLSFVVTISLFNLLPSIKILSALGRETMFYYLYHGLIIRFLLQPVVTFFFFFQNFLFMLIYLIGTVGLIYILRQIKLFRWLLHPSFSKHNIENDKK